MDVQTAQEFETTVSVIMASHDCGAFIAAAVESVLAQTLTDWELIVSDDASRDNSLEVLSRFADEKRIRVIASDINRGAAGARNLAISQARGRFIAFLDSDDVWKPHKLERQIGFMRNHGVPFSFSSYERIDESGGALGLVRAPASVTYRQLLAGNVIGCLTAIYDRAFFGRVMMPDIVKRQDYALWLKLLKNVDRAVSLPESLGYYRMRQGSVSANKASAAQFTWRVLRELEGLSLPAASFYFSRYALRGLWSHHGPKSRT